MEKEADDMRTFDMGALRTNLPQKRGLSRYYSGKSKTFRCIADAHCMEDLKKQEHHEAKRRKKQHTDHQRTLVPPLSCREVSTSTQCASPAVVGM
ncbi:protein OXIDATIVE STRESS 3 LIKE 4-like [Cornus florida]|uniref:protein OXIDATIVE STRESS 3 LIKE 4-like n=1 Tax=Cornus florida TaxID=4283 RepID=UPI0028966B11|nr:protein OXIDATIVE STRESS 3 LIKE 4-like [Cornus florida]